MNWCPENTSGCSGNDIDSWLKYTSLCNKDMRRRLNLLKKVMVPEQNQFWYRGNFTSRFPKLKVQLFFEMTGYCLMPFSDFLKRPIREAPPAETSLLNWIKSGESQNIAPSKRGRSPGKFGERAPMKSSGSTLILPQKTLILHFSNSFG